MDPLMTPLTMKSLTLRNRIVSTSHEPAYREDGLPKDRYRAYHVEKARGGVGLTMIGGSAVVRAASRPAGPPPTTATRAVRHPDGTYQLFRIGDAVAGRNVHAAMLDAARLCREI